MSETSFGTARTDPRTRPMPLVERRFGLSERQEAAARAWLDEGGQGACCAAKTSAAVVYVREGAEGLETFLTYRRSDASPLGAVGFPGGIVCGQDWDPVGWFGPTPAQWAQKLGHDDVALARGAVVAAVRGSFEEAGILLAGPDDIQTVEATVGADLMAAREKIAGHELEFSQYLKRGGLKIRTDLLRPLGRWLTPDFCHRRYDTHFFAAVVPVGQQPTLLESRGIWGRWVLAEALTSDLQSTALGEEIGRPETAGATVADLVSPGVLCILESLSSSQSTIGYLTKKRAVRVNQARLVEGEDGLDIAFTAPQDRCRPRAKGD